MAPVLVISDASVSVPTDPVQTLTTDLFHTGYRDQVSIDFSEAAIHIMEQRNQDLGLQWTVMDVRSMTFEDNSFDIAIDKGTLDAMLHGSLWDPEDEVKENTKAYIDEVDHLLMSPAMPC